MRVVLPQLGVTTDTASSNFFGRAFPRITCGSCASESLRPMPLEQIAAEVAAAR